jgi:hypothetical protein
MNRNYIIIAYLITLFFMGLTGFAQMPIFKRYYIADIPGLGWLADFYLTHDLHYLGAIFLLAFFAYLALDHLLNQRRRYRLTGAAGVRLLLLFCITATGVFRVFKNLPDVSFSPGFTMFIDIAHLGFMMLLMGVGAAFMLMKRRWLAPRREPLPSGAGTAPKKI